MESMFAQAAQQQNAQPATPNAPAPAAPAQGSMESMFDQAAQQQAQQQPTMPETSTPPEESMVQRLERRTKELFSPSTRTDTDTEKTLGNIPVEKMTREQREQYEAGSHRKVSDLPRIMWDTINTPVLPTIFGEPKAEKQGRAIAEAPPTKFSMDHPKTAAVGRFVAGFDADAIEWVNQNITPLTVAMAAAGGPAGKLAAGTFGTMSAKGVYDAIADMRKNGITYKNSAAFANAGGGALFATAGLAHPMEAGAPKVEAPKVEPETTPERTTLLPTTTEPIAGVKVPISAIAQENPSVATKVAAHIATPGMAADFQKRVTAPEATRAAVSVLGQPTEDAVNAHEALMEGKPAPETITGTDQPSKYSTVDEMAQARKQTSEKTYQHADQISQRETKTWEDARDKAIETHKAGVDQHNSVVDQYNSALSEGEEPMERVTFNPDEVRGIPEKPKTFNELKSELDTAKANSASNDAAVREKAFQTEVPKAEKNLDKWFQDHSDEISPAEYQSAKKLRAEAEIYQNMANTLRGAMNKSSITGNTLRGLEATIDNKAIRRGQAPGQFRRLLGDAGYDNWTKVSKLFDPVKDAPAGLRSWGQHALEYAALHLLSPLGIVGKAAVELLLNRVMFNPSWGEWLGNAAESLKSHAVLPQNLVETFKGLWKNERGEAGAPGTVPLTAEDEGLAQEHAKPTFESTDNGVDEDGNKNHILAIQRDGDVVGHLNISQTTPDSWRVNDATVRKGLTGQGLGRAGYEEAFRQAAQAGMKTVDSDISMTSKARGVWEALRKKYPDAITEDNGQYSADVTKMGHEGPSMEDQFAKAAAPQPEVVAPASAPAKVMASNPESEISTRSITSGDEKKGTFKREPNATENATGWDAIEQAETQKPGFMRDLLDKVLSYKDNGLKLTEEQKADPRKGLKAVVDHWASNLEWLHDNMPAEHREIAKQWYDSAHRMATDIATKYGTHPRKVAAVIAALSPQNPWDMNVGQAERIVQMYQTALDHPFTPEMDRAITDRKVKALKGKEPNIEFANELENIRGKKFNDLIDPNDPKATRYNQALWMRMLDEAHGNRQTPVYAPDGKIRSYQNFNWGLADPMAKSIEIMSGDGSAQSIHDIIGDGHKIRNFYNNIISPDSELGHATIDTHHVNADMLKPMSSKNDVEVKDNFGGAPQHKGTGQKGTYSLHHAALKQAADARGILPREMQSITWEAIKTLMGDEKKTPELRKAVTEVWQKYQKGGLTLNQARENIVKAAGSFDKPAWAKERANNGQSNGGGNEAGGGSPDETKLPPVGVSGQSASPAGAGGGRDVSGAVPTEGRAEAGGEGKAKALTSAYDAIMNRGVKKAPVKVTDTPAFKKWFGESKVVDDEGNPQVVYHGTTHDFDTFHPERGNDENAFGKGYYFTSDPTDASENYAGVGPDLKSRIEHRAEEIMNESDKNYSTDKAAYEAATKQATKELAGGKPNVMPVHVKMENPVEISPKGGTRFEMNFDEDTGEESGSAVDLYNSIMRTAAGYEDRDGNTVDGQKLWNEIAELGPEFTAHEVYDRVNAVLPEQDIYSPGDFLKEVFKDMGFDGIKQDAFNQFSQYGSEHAGHGGMDNMAPGTTHYVAFEPTQVKSAIGNKGTFNPKDPSILAQSVKLGKGEHTITADVDPPGMTPEKIAQWRGKPQPQLSRKPNGRLDYSGLTDIADHLNANVSREDMLSSTAHEVAHAFLQHELGFPTDNLKMRLGHRAVKRGVAIEKGGSKSSITGISGGSIDPGKGYLQERYDTVKNDPEGLKSFLQDYTTQLMGGRAIEEMLGHDSPSEITEHTKADRNMVKNMLRSHNIPSYIHDALMSVATERAKSIIKDKFDTFQHISSQAANHYGGETMDSETFHHYRNGGVFKKK